MAQWTVATLSASLGAGVGIGLTHHSVCVETISSYCVTFEHGRHYWVAHYLGNYVSGSGLAYFGEGIALSTFGFRRYEKIAGSSFEISFLRPYLVLL
jgi:hypothetical protein